MIGDHDVSGQRVEASQQNVVQGKSQRRRSMVGVEGNGCKTATLNSRHQHSTSNCAPGIETPGQYQRTLVAADERLKSCQLCLKRLSPQFEVDGMNVDDPQSLVAVVQVEIGY